MLIQRHKQAHIKLKATRINQASPKRGEECR